MKNHNWAIVFAILLIINITLACKLSISVISALANYGTTASQTGYVQVKVLESGSLKPITNATVCIVETRTYTTTDKYGCTQKIAVPIVPNNNFDISLERDWGEFTILVYKNGYATYISFYNEVYAGTTRVGLICELVPIINETDPKLTTNVAVPNSAWIETLISLYKK